MVQIENGTVAIDTCYYATLERKAETLEIVKRMINSDRYVTVDDIKTIIDMPVESEESKND